MKNLYYLIVFILINTIAINAQSLDDAFSIKNMKKDLQVFKNIRLKANSGLYKYRTKKQIDSIYKWADKEVEKSKTYRDFYNIICKLTDFEGSLHNNTSLSNKVYKSMKNEGKGYFPLPIKLLEDKVIVNIKNNKIPLGAEIISINDITIKETILKLNKYYTTDGLNVSGKSIGLNYSFSKYYRLHFGLQDSFKIAYKQYQLDKIEYVTLKSIGFKNYYNNVKNRYSKPFDEPNFKDWKINEMYTYNVINKTTGLLTINNFAIGNNKKSPEHLKYTRFLDSIFSNIKKEQIKNLIIDMRYNGGGTDPNDLVTYAYLTQRNFSENKQAWISFEKIPYLKYFESKVPTFLRPLFVGKYNKAFKKEFSLEKDGKYFQNNLSSDHKIRVPNKNAFTGKIFLMISPRIASAGSLFSAMVAGNSNTTIIGKETMGTYYGHNGHTPFSYVLPKSKIITSFSIVNLEQDVLKKENQKFGRGIIPDYKITQTHADFLTHTDTQMNFVLELITKK